MEFKGLFTAMITPFKGDQVDLEGLEFNIERQIEAGVQGIVLLGSTGESATLTEVESEEIIKKAVEVAKGRILVIIGTGSNVTARSILHTRNAEALGADGAIIVTPYYNRPTQEGLYRHFAAIAESSNLPILLYNVPARTGVNIELATLLRLSEIPSIVGVKEASGNINQIVDILYYSLQKRPDWTILSGDDAITLPIMAVGAHGVVSVVSNFVPERMTAFINSARAGDFQVAKAMHEELFDLFKLAFLESNPIPIKALMELAGLPAGGCRAPLCEIAEVHREKLKAYLAKELLPV